MDQAVFRNSVMVTNKPTILSFLIYLANEVFYVEKL